MLPEVHHELPGWVLLWAALERAAGDPAPLRLRIAAEARARHTADTLAQHPTVAAVRKLFRAAGCDPTRYRPSSEALLRRVLKGEELPAIDPLVDLNNCLSVDLVVPSCVIDAARVAPPLVLRGGRAGDVLDSMRGHAFDAAGKPLLADREGPFGSPITDAERVKVRAETRSAWLVAYLPAGAVDPARAAARLGELAAGSGAVTLSATGTTS